MKWKKVLEQIVQFGLVQQITLIYEVVVEFDLHSVSRINTQCFQKYFLIFHKNIVPSIPPFRSLSLWDAKAPQMCNQEGFFPRMSQHSLLLKWKISLSPYFMIFWGIWSELFYGLGQWGIGTACAGSHSANTGDMVKCKKTSHFYLQCYLGRNFPIM